jgi:hypothetical protein
MEHDLSRGRFSVIDGAHPAVPSIVEELVAGGREVVLVADNDPSEVPARARLFAGDPTSDASVRRSRPAHAENALVVAPDAGDVLVICVALRAAVPTFRPSRSPACPRSPGRCTTYASTVHSPPTTLWPISSP